MGWKGTMRSLQAASRRAARDAERRHKAALKQQALNDAADAVDAWEDYVSNLISVHLDLADSIDWHAMAASQKPEPPENSRPKEHHARKRLETFKPGFFDFFVGGSDRRKSRLESAIATALIEDEKTFRQEMLEYEKNLEEWSDDNRMARRLLDGDIEAVKEVLTNLETMAEEDRIGTNIEFSITSDEIHAYPLVHSDEIIPDYRRKLRASGSLSETKMLKGQFNELYQDYVASVALKVAGDIFHVLPYDEVFVTCRTSMLNKSTGHKEDTPILSVQFVKDTFKKLNLANLDPSDSLSNFNHNMKFRKTTGFQPIEPLG